MNHNKLWRILEHFPSYLIEAKNNYDNALFKQCLSDV